MRIKSVVIAVFIFVLYAVSAFSASIQVTWNANTEEDIAGYKVYYAQPGDAGWSSSGDEVTFSLGVLPHVSELVTVPSFSIPAVPGPYAVAVTAIDTSGNESAFSPVSTTLVSEPQATIVVPTIQLPPAAPVQVIINIEEAAK